MQPFDYYEAEHIEGLQELVTAELAGLGVHLLPVVRADGVPFVGRHGKRNRPAPNLVTDTRLRGLRLPTAVYGVLFFPIPRPKALLGHAHWQRLLAGITAVRQGYTRHTFQTFRFSAAGQETPLFQRLKTEFARDTGLKLDEQEADLFIRVRRTAKEQKAGWELLIRLTPRPLATRPWRVANYPGALSGPLCAALHELAGYRAGDRLLNLMCGSGSLLAERPQPEQTALMLGIDSAGEALALARQNVCHLPRAQLLQADVTCMPLLDGSFDCLLADLPWGQLIGDTAVHDQLYPAVLAEAARVCTPHGRFALITQDSQRLDRHLKRQAAWQLTKRLKITQGRVRPTIFLLTREA